MKKKQSEHEFVRMAKRHNFYVRKFKDVWFCAFCGKQQYKSDEMPDYQIVVNGIAHLVEIKQSTGHWVFSDEEGEGIRKIQRETMDAWEKDHSSCFLFLVLGDGRAPKGRKAWLIPWSEWKMYEHYLLDEGQKSIQLETKRNLGAEKLLVWYEVDWEDSGWAIPEYHVFWDKQKGDAYAISQEFAEVGA